jgi:glycerol-3-phosphate acyltransferase PlsX
MATPSSPEFTAAAPSAITLAVDCMGGDHGPRVTLAACRAFLERHSEASLLLVGAPAALAGFAAHPRARIVAASEVVGMDDPVEIALRKKKDSSMRVAIQQVKDGAAQAAISAGNTGALMAIARYLLKTLDGIDRPAIAATAQRQGRGDDGARPGCQRRLRRRRPAAVRCARLGPGVGAHRQRGAFGRSAQYWRGSHQGQRNDQESQQLLRTAANSKDLNFYGNVEGNDIFKGTTDIVVCDGFVGNVALKASEGVASMIGEFIRVEFSRSIFTKVAAIVAYPVLKAFKSRLDHRRYNGAALLGLRGLVFKSHGSADEVAFGQALDRAYDAARNNLLDRVQARIAHAAPLAARQEPAAPVDATAIHV